MDAGFVRCGVKVNALISGCSCLLLRSLARLGGFTLNSGISSISLSPLFNDGKPLIEWVEGWLKSFNTKRFRLKGWYWFKVGFIESKSVALELCNAIIKGAELMGWSGRIEGIEVVSLDKLNTGLGGVWFKLITPAQFKAITTTGSMIISNPSPQLLLKTPLKLLGEEDIGGWTVQVKGGFKPVTVALDKDRFTWGVMGEGVLMPLKQAPYRILRALHRAALASKYIGVGKSRLIGLGQADFKIGVTI